MAEKRKTVGLKDRVRALIAGGDQGLFSGAAPTSTLTGRALEIAGELRIEIARESDGQVEADGFDGQASLIDDGILDSLGSVRILLLIEERYGVHIEEVDLLGRLHCLDALAGHVASAESPAPDVAPE